MANAQDTTGMIGIRSDLNAKGIDNSRIGYNSSTGYVTIDGQNFIKPTTVNGGVSYADPTAYNQQYNTFSSGQATKSAEDKYMDALNNPEANPYDEKVSDTLAKYYEQLTNPTPYDVYSSPEYAAYEAQAQRGADRGIRAAQESMGAAGFGRSTNLAERAQGIQNDANEYLNLQVVPQLNASHDAKQAQQLAALGTYLEALTGQQGVYDTRTQSGIQNLASALDYLSGRSDRAEDVQYRAERDKVTDAQQQELLEIQQAAVTGMYKGKQTTAEQQRILQNAWDESIQQGKVSASLSQLTGIPAGTLLESTRQFNANLAEQKAGRAQQASIAAADRAQRASDNEADRAQRDRLAAADREERAQEREAQNANGLNADERKQEGSALMSALRSGEITPREARIQIQDDMSLGIYSQADYDYLMGVVSNAESTGASSSGSSSTTATGEDGNTTAPISSNEEKELEAEAKKLGYPTLDYISWYRSPNGKSAGLDFETWQAKYGPRIGF